MTFLLRLKEKVKTLKFLPGSYETEFLFGDFVTTVPFVLTEHQAGKLRIPEPFLRFL